MKQKAVEIRHLTHTYPDGKTALRDVSIDIHEGESVGIVGPNGAGKTTFILHLNGILRSEAEVRIFGMPVEKEHLRAIRSRVGLVFQNPDDQLFSPTVFDDVAFGPLNLGLPEEQVRNSVEDALARLGMEGYGAKTPHHLSSGEKKKIAIATVLSLPCELLVLDEPTSNLDPAGRRNIIRLLRELPLTKIIVGHDLEMIAAACSRVVVFNNGAIAADGSAAQVLGDQVLMEKNHLEAVPEKTLHAGPFSAVDGK